MQLCVMKSLFSCLLVVFIVAAVDVAGAIDGAADTDAIAIAIAIADAAWMDSYSINLTFYTSIIAC
jgi:hypothetical protein